MSSTPDSDRSRLRIVDTAECLSLLRSVPLGRLIYVYGGLPAIRLVNFVLDDDTIIFGTEQGDKFRAAERGDVVAFEADDVDMERHLGWTVTAIGHLSVATPDQSTELRRRLPLHSWLPMAEPHLVLFTIESVHGRRLVPWGQRPRSR